VSAEAFVTRTRGSDGCPFCGSKKL